MMEVSKYPNLIVMDNTHGTNDRTMLFCHLTGKFIPRLFFVIFYLIFSDVQKGVDSNNQPTSWFSALLPNQQRLTFLWVLNVCLPVFYGKLRECVTTFLRY
jgi:hypothetical protein